MALLIFTNAIKSLGGGIECSNCEESMGFFGDGVLIESHEKEVEINNLLDEMKLEACLDGMKNKSLEEIEVFFKKK